jgi:homoisocitrate dehydrogenase
MLVGGLGVAYSGNIGEQAAVFEPVHGSAPNLVGTDTANPAATVLAAAMMLDYLGESDHAERVQAAVSAAIAAGQVTPDMSGSLSTHEMTQKIICSLQEQ